MILLDTCTLLWLVADQSRMSDAAKTCLRENTGSLYVSAVSAFEIAQKHAGGKLKLAMMPGAWFALACERHGLNTLPLQPAHAFTAAALPPLHKDPFDRLLMGSAIHEQAKLLTPDPLIRQYPEVRTHW